MRCSYLDHVNYGHVNILILSSKLPPSHFHKIDGYSQLGMLLVTQTQHI